MTSQEIKVLLGVPTSTLSDWECDEKRASLVHLLRGLDTKSATRIIASHKQLPKYSQKTRRLRLKKSWFKKDLLWSRHDGAEMEIDHLITIYLSRPDQDDIVSLLKLFGYERVIHVLQKIEMHPSDYTEASEQVLYAYDRENYYKTHTLPPLHDILKHPKKRYVDALLDQYSADTLIEMAQKQEVSYPALFSLQKMTSSAA